MFSFPLESAVHTISIISDLTVIEAWAAHNQYRYIYVDGSDVHTIEAFFARANEGIGCPYFGYNWDALLDCLITMEWMPAPGYVIVYDQTQVFARSDPAEYATAVEILTDAAESWDSQNNEPVMIVLLRGEHN